MSPERARTLLELMQSHARTFPGKNPRSCLPAEERAHLERLLARMPGAKRIEQVLERIVFGCDGWRVGTVVQSTRISPGPFNRWIVAAGPIPLGYEGHVLLVDEGSACAMDQMSELHEEWSMLLGVLCDYYPADVFEPVPLQGAR